jgi:hypothetical protein
MLAAIVVLFAGCAMEPEEETSVIPKATVSIAISNPDARVISLEQWNEIDTWKYGVSGKLITGSAIAPFECDIGSQTIAVQGYKGTVLYVFGHKNQTLVLGANTVTIDLISDIHDDYDPDDNIPTNASVTVTANPPKMVQRIPFTNEELRAIVFETDSTTYLSEMTVTKYSSTWTSVTYTARVSAVKGTANTSTLKASGTIYKTLWELSQMKLKSLGWVSIEETDTFNLAPVEVKAINGIASFNLTLNIEVRENYRSGYVSWQFSDDNHQSPNSVILMYIFSDLVYNKTLDKWLGASASDFS